MEHRFHRFNRSSWIFYMVDVWKAVLSVFICVLVLSSCMPSPRPSTALSGSITVMAAASLTESFTEIGELFKSQNPGVQVNFSFAGSQQLAQQLSEGSPADVFASASQKYMDAAITANRVKKEDASVFVKNKLVVIYPAANPAKLTQLQDLARSGLKLILAAKEVPVGQYSLDFLDKANQDTAFGVQFKDDVLKNVVSYEDNVKSVLTKVTLGEADAGIVYSSDVSPANAAKVGEIAIPDNINVIASYPIAPIQDSQSPQLAQAFIKLVLSTEGQNILAKYGFAPAARP
jgi:molybdate transport system substrate-binding protein